MEKQTSAGIVVYRKRDNTVEYLILLYSKGHWDFPKGHLEAGETKEQAARRELKEETNLTADIASGFEESFSYRFMENGQLVEKTVYYFVGQAHDDTVTLSHEHTDFKWLKPNAALKQLTYQNAKDLLKKVDVFLSSP